MADPLAKIVACHEKNVGIIGRIEAVKEVKMFSYSVEWPVLKRDEVDRCEGKFLRPEVIESTHVEEIAAFLERWRFPGELRDDFSEFVKLIDWLNFKPVSWEETKQLNESIKKVACALGAWTSDATGKMGEKREGELCKFLDNLQRIQKALYALEEEAMGQDSRLAQMERDLAQQAKGINDKLRQWGLRPPPSRFIDSVILSDREHSSQLLAWYGNPGEWDLIYRGTRDGMTGEAFHVRADGKGPTLTVVKRGTRIFGGYTQVPWTSEGGGDDLWVPDETASLFLLASEGGIEPCLFPVKDSSHAVIHSSRVGPVFGRGARGADLVCCTNGGATSWGRLGTGYQATTGNGEHVLAGDTKEFEPTEIEVFVKRDQGSSRKEQSNITNSGSSSGSGSSAA
uniref:TLDc domain-containing protein n=1 Tax=Chromera velia CCMP2878 TaxID=1169474 RepID=A0A0G4GPW4_9ALVE|eukprot:Cvel_22860.t1-p1 / transcript=Cvel_22860.t1 / gene=Cvel_22860 / organism=Chromera_velia_CCMP2878 / gene_product=hypothetical protein / transcript_product=hypothetical protein / location=Cvel_scaffold2294:8244-9434(-) / protein_length=397 / sequence_SO=supercontig / SO=protein_coding / is_pseudo=false